MHSKYDNMHKNVMFYALIYNNNHIIVCVNCMLSLTTLLSKDKDFIIDKEWESAFDMLKQALIEAPIL